MSRIYIMALEPLESRYTGQWFDGIPKLLRSEISKRNLNISVYNIAGNQTSKQTTSGAFLDFAATNIWKNTQINTIAENFANGYVGPGDKFLFTDAWHPGIIQVKYMSELLDIPVEIHSIFHAGSYDPQDFLGRKIKDKHWSLSFERSVFHASNHNYFATRFHMDLFSNAVLGGIGVEHCRKFTLSGQPHNELIKALQMFKGTEKKRQIVFPHRIAPEKQPEIFRDLALHMKDVEFLICQDKKLSKDEYHRILAESMIVFSANLQETLGISSIEGLIVGAMPFVPDRLSYREMYSPVFKYESNWTINWDSYVENRSKIITVLYERLAHFSTYRDAISTECNNLVEKYFTATPMLNNLLKI